MQYILTQDELDALHAKANAAKGYPTKKKLQEFCTMIANTLPVQGGWYDGKVWGCILTEKEDDGYDEWYCNECPAREVCPYDYKSWSK